jgi:bla regulator protein BlaR1
MNTLNGIISNFLGHAAFTAPLFDALLKSFVLLALAGLLCLCCRRAAAATRHLIWLLAVASLPCLPLLASLPHSWQRPIWSVSTGFNSGNQFSLALDLAPDAGAGNSPAESTNLSAKKSTSHDPAKPNGSRLLAARFNASWLTAAVMVWLAGAALGLASVITGHVRLSRLAREAVPLRIPGSTLLLEAACQSLGVGRPVTLLQSGHHLMPLAWGWWKPIVLLPAQTAEWPPERLRVVLLHELAHVKRWDCLTQLLTRLVCAFYWFNPLVWLAAREMCL